MIRFTRAEVLCGLAWDLNDQEEPSRRGIRFYFIDESESESLPLLCLFVCLFVLFV